MTKLRLIFFLLVPATLAAQQYTISTIAGRGPLATVPALSVSIRPQRAAIDATGIVYFSDSSTNRIWELGFDGAGEPIPLRNQKKRGFVLWALGNA